MNNFGCKAFALNFESLFVSESSVNNEVGVGRSNRGMEAMLIQGNEVWDGDSLEDRRQEPNPGSRVTPPP